jgi:hypothetical protein
MVSPAPAQPLAWVFLPLACVALLLAAPGEAFATTATAPAETAGEMPWWFWPMALFVWCFVLGVLAVPAGVGGGVLFVPIVGGFFPFHMDFVRGTGLMVALAGALAAGPGLLRSGMASLRLSMPLVLLASAASIVGAMVGLAMPAHVVQTALGATILGIVVLMWLAKKSEYPDVPQACSLSTALGMHGVFHDPATGKSHPWKVHRSGRGLLLFIGIGVLAGMFGLGAGWANTPVLNLLMGAPLKVSVSRSKFMLSIVDTPAAWVYLNEGAVLAMLTVPSLIGIMLGSFIGVKVLKIVSATTVRRIVIGMLLVAGGRALLKGLGIWA